MVNGFRIVWKLYRKNPYEICWTNFKNESPRLVQDRAGDRSIYTYIDDSILICGENINILMYGRLFLN